MIKLLDFLAMEHSGRTKVKFNMHAGDPTRLAWDLLRDDDPEWIDMNAWRRKKDPNANLEKAAHLLAFAQYYPYGPKYYMFGGLYRVSVKDPNLYDAPGYQLDLQDEYKDYRKRLIIRLKEPIGQNLYLRWLSGLENRLDPEVYELLPASKLSEFPGYSDVRLTHSQLRSIYDHDEPDWKQALSAVKAVYVITDLCTGKLYVGSAYGDGKGVWQRWSRYADPKDLTGGNKEFKQLRAERGDAYIMENFQYSLLEIFDTKTRDGVIRERESHWKDVLQSRRFGYNAN